MLRAAFESWDVLEGEGPRYPGPPEGRLFSMTPTTVLLALSGTGAPSDANPVTTPGRTLELLRAAISKMDASGAN